MESVTGSNENLWHGVLFSSVLTPIDSYFLRLHAQFLILISCRARVFLVFVFYRG